MKFRRRVKVLPGVTLNFSKSGVSTTVGPRGLNMNFNRHGTFLNTGLPGTGIYDRHRISGPRSKRKQGRQPNADLIAQYLTPAPSTPEVKQATCVGLSELHSQLMECHQEREALKRDIALSEKKLKRRHILHIASRVLIVGFFTQKIRDWRNEEEAYLSDLEQQLQQCSIPLSIQCDDEMRIAYARLLKAYADMLECHSSWDHTERRTVDKVRERSTAGEAIMRKRVQHKYANIPVISADFDGMHLENATGADLFLYPAFLALIEGPGHFALLGLAELSIEASTIRFVENDEVPPDTTIVDHMWYKSNKDGSRDRRFRDNWQIPVVEYGALTIKHPSGLEECFAFSQVDPVERFAEAFEAFKAALPPL